jgi:5-(carboxyamino)imidazole ribonucleotide synthase
MSSDALPPGSLIGIVGGGQLGRMLAQAAAKLGFRTSIYAPEVDSPAFDVATYRHCAAYDNEAALRRFADEADVLTFEFENVPSRTLEVIEGECPVYPPRRALEVAQDRLEERRFLKSLDLPFSPYEEVLGAGMLPAAWERLTGGRQNSRLFLKKARFGYDGKGQVRIESRADMEQARSWLGEDTAILELGVGFWFELSILCVRDRAGRIAFYDPPQNIHRDGILRESIVPAPMSAGSYDLVYGHAAKIAEALDYVGVLAVEMFGTERNGGLDPILNEIAPRVHNSGHWTLEACFTGQFENHVRAVAGWPLGSTERYTNARLVNLLGAEANDWHNLLAADPNRSLTLYGKGEPRPGRKMGHYVELSPRDSNHAPTNSG